MNRNTQLTRALLFAIIVMGTFPILLPFFWLISSSLKTYDRVYRYPPEWLPFQEIIHTQSTPGSPELVLNVIDRNEDTQTGVWRVKVLSGREQTLVLPKALIESRPTTTYLARIDGREVAVKLLATQGAQVTVEIPNPPVEISVATHSVRSQTQVKTVISLLRQQMPVQSVRITAGQNYVQLLEPSAPFDIAYRKIQFTADSLAYLANDAQLLPIRILQHHPLAGVATIQLLHATKPFAVPVNQVFTLQATDYFVDLHGQPTPVKWVKRGHGHEMSVVKLVHRPHRRTIPVTALKPQPAVVYFTRLFGQEVQLQLLNHAPDADPVAVKILSTLTLDENLIVHAKKFAPQWQNYMEVLRKEPFHYYLLNTLFISLCSMLGQILSCSLVGYAFARLNFPAKKLFFLVLLSTMMLPNQVTLIPQFILYVKLGWLDSFKPLIVPTYLAQSAFFVFLFRQYFMTIPLDLEDAARIDGCSPFYSYWHIMLPLAKPVIVTVAVFTFMWTWNDFLYPLLYLNSDEHQTLALALQNYKTNFGLRDPHLLMAASTMMMLPSMLIFFLAQKTFIQGVVVTGVKG